MTKDTNADSVAEEELKKLILKRAFLFGAQTDTPYGHMQTTSPAEFLLLDNDAKIKKNSSFKNMDKGNQEKLLQSTAVKKIDHALYLQMADKCFSSAIDPRLVEMIKKQVDSYYKKKGDKKQILESSLSTIEDQVSQPFKRSMMQKLFDSASKATTQQSSGPTTTPGKGKTAPSKVPKSSSWFSKF